MDGTIAAISTALGEGAISIVRISGPDAVCIAGRILKRREFPEHARMYLTSLHDEAGNIIDRVLCVHFMKPHSYTGEDIIEIHTHGGIMAAKSCLELVLSNGARIAEPGEFTRRSFVNGRIDLSQAEGVLSLIEARSNEALNAAARTLSGELSRAVKKVHDYILELQGNLEVQLDFPEGETLEGLDVVSGIDRAIQSLEGILSQCSAGIILRNGVNVVISGRPNAGKSSLLNALLGVKRAIVTDIPGTTRDIIEGRIIIGGIPVRLSDTAGLRDTGDIIEAEGVRLALEAMNDSDICLYVVDGSCETTQEDISYIRGLEGKQAVIVLNKSDLENRAGDIDTSCRKINVSAKNGEGIDALKSAIYEMAGKNSLLSSGLNVSAFQLEELRSALSALQEGRNSAVKGDGEDITAGMLGSARISLLRVLGAEVGDELLDSMFRRFCVGK